MHAHRLALVSTANKSAYSTHTYANEHAIQAPSADDSGRAGTRLERAHSPTFLRNRDYLNY